MYIFGKVFIEYFTSCTFLQAEVGEATIVEVLNRKYLCNVTRNGNGSLKEIFVEIHSRTIETRHDIMGRRFLSSPKPCVIFSGQYFSDRSIQLCFVTRFFSNEPSDTANSRCNII